MISSVKTGKSAKLCSSGCLQNQTGRGDGGHFQALAQMACLKAGMYNRQSDWYAAGGDPTMKRSLCKASKCMEPRQTQRDIWVISSTATEVAQCR